MICMVENCVVLLNNHHYYCDEHLLERQNELKMKEEILVNKRLNDPTYIHDTKIFLKCKDILIKYEDEDEEDDSDDDSDDDINWMLMNLHMALFSESYKNENCPNRLNIIIQETKEAKLECCTMEHGIINLPFQIHRYECYNNFLIKWIEEAKLIEKNNLIKELPLIHDISTIVTKLMNNI